MILVDLTGKRFGSLIVIERAKIDVRRVYWTCYCEVCEKFKDIRACHLKNKKNCGCTGGKQKGLSWTSEYKSWSSMMNRCYDKTCDHYDSYGGRGIRVCKRWRDSFLDFFEDMGLKPSPKHSIDRIDNDGNYCLENCRWATQKEQSVNKRKSIYVVYKGESMPIKEVSEILGIHYNTILRRVKRGFSAEEIVSPPSVKHQMATRSREQKKMLIDKHSKI